MKAIVLIATAVMALAGSPAGAFPQNTASKAYSIQVGHVVTLSWQASTSPGVTYNVYVGSVSGGPYQRINASPITTLTYQDLGAIGGNTYYYVATAYDPATGLESVHSNEVQVIVPAP